MSAQRDPFLQKVRVSNAQDAIRNSLRAALQRNQVYQPGTSPRKRKEIRESWSEEILRHSPAYKASLSEKEHVQKIVKISDSVSKQHGDFLFGGKLRIGTSQKALNLYIKFLWRLGHIPVAPHCPVDGIVLKNAGLKGSWTKSDSVEEYQNWIKNLKEIASSKTLADWEYDLWNGKS